MGREKKKLSELETQIKWISILICPLLDDFRLLSKTENCLSLDKVEEGGAVRSRFFT